jgi:hypothetical protein
VDTMMDSSKNSDDGSVTMTKRLNHHLTAVLMKRTMTMTKRLNHLTAV